MNLVQYYLKWSRFWLSSGRYFLSLLSCNDTDFFLKAAAVVTSLWICVNETQMMLNFPHRCYNLWMLMYFRLLWFKWMLILHRKSLSASLGHYYARPTCQWLKRTNDQLVYYLITVNNGSMERLHYRAEKSSPELPMWRIYSNKHL